MGSHQSKQKNKSAQSAGPTFSQHFPTQVSPHYIQLDPIYYDFLPRMATHYIVIQIGYSESHQTSQTDFEFLKLKLHSRFHPIACARYADVTSEAR